MKGDCWQKWQGRRESPPGRGEGRLALRWVGCARADPLRQVQLPPVLREAFVMHYVDGMPYETMAALLDASVSALKMRVYRAR